MTITITRPQTISRRARSAAIAAVLTVGGTTLAYWGVQTTADDPAGRRTSPAEVDVSAQLAEWARTSGVVGLSPAGATAADDVGVDVSADLTEWARTSGVIGLSPAGATPADDVSADLAEWARTNGVIGLSPASATTPN